MWGRLGTPTARALSGTVEEFERAYARYSANPSCVQFLVYFSNEPIAPDAVDVDQLGAVKKFDQDLSPPGQGRFLYTVPSGSVRSTGQKSSDAFDVGVTPDG